MTRFGLGGNDATLHGFNTNIWLDFTVPINDDRISSFLKMVFFSPVAFARFTVKKTTGGRLWNKPWGIPKLTVKQKRNQKKNAMHTRRNVEILKLAEALQPARHILRIAKEKLKRSKGDR